MGSNNSTEFSGTQDNDTTDSAMSGARRGSNEDEPDLQSLMAYLIRSGQIRFIGQDDSDDSECSDSDFLPSTSPPKVDMKPDNTRLSETDLYMSILQSSGQRPIDNGKADIVTRPDVVNMVFKREIGSNKQRKFSNGEKCLISSSYLPNKKTQVASYRQKAFCGSFSEDGETFVSACQDQLIRVYNTSGANSQFELTKTIQARDVGWSVLDVAFSPDGRYAAYSSWSDCIHLCNLYGDFEIHEALPLRPGEHSFCIFSLKFSVDNKEILGGANDRQLYVYDREANKRTLKVFAHEDDVNTVCFADDSSQILYSGGDDGLCKVWDRRTLREEHPVPVGVLAGHCDGITYIDTKGDARFLISNSKDQTMKLWDVRQCSSQSAIEAAQKSAFAQRWDYRWQQVPKRVMRKKELPGDTSLMTYRGHCILHTLIRCKFSPMETTGQRYLYTGCSTGAVVVYDLLTGNVVRKLQGHNSCVRDVSWHPSKNVIISTSWDYTLGRWYYHDDHAHSPDPGEKVFTKLHKGPDEKRRPTNRRRSPRFMDF